MHGLCLRFCRLFVFFLLIFIDGYQNVARAQNVGDVDFTQGFMLKAEPLSFGGAYRALANSNAAILYNPAGLVQRKGQIAISGDYAMIGSTNSHMFGVAMLDYSANDQIALGLSYDRDTPTLGGLDVTVQQITLSAATPLLGSFLSLGGSVKGYLTEVTSSFVDGPDSVDVDLGILVQPIPSVSLALTAHNIIGGQTFEEFPFQLGFGAALLLPPHARIAVDIVRDFQTLQTQNINAYFGGEIRIVEGAFVRGGFGLDRIRNDNFYSIGACIAGPKISLLFTFSQRLNPEDETYAMNLEFGL